MGDIFADKPVSINGIFLGMDSDHVILYQAREGRAFFKSASDTGEIQEIVSVPSDLLPSFFWTKNYAGNGMIGFLTKEDEFVLYEQNHRLAKFPDIRRTAMPPWYAYMPDRDTIFMEWACYETRSGRKKWDFPLPVAERAYKKFLACETWRELPNGLIMTQINVDQENIYISLMDQSGNIRRSVSLPIFYAYHNVGVAQNYIYFIQPIENTRFPAEVILFDFNLNEIGRYNVDSNRINYEVWFDSHNKHFYVLGNGIVTRVNIMDGQKRIDPIPFDQIEISSWGVLPNDMLYFVKKERELFFWDPQENMECVLRHKIKGYCLKLVPLKNGNVLLVSLNNRKKEQVILQVICFDKQAPVN